MASTSKFQLPANLRPIDRLLGPIHQFLRIEAAGGILLVLCTFIALMWANSSWGESYDHFWHTYITVGFGTASLKLSLAHFVNDGLMAIFFFVVGLEIKREFLVGELASRRKATLPIAAAIGGMVVPALVYALVVMPAGGEGSQGWGIPMATDIAFALGIMAMLGSRVPLSLKIFLTALAIVDDIGAVLVIAIFYTSEIHPVSLLGAILILVLSALANRAGIRTPLAYGLLGLIMWLMLLNSGVHATIGGVLLALTIPSRMRIQGGEFVEIATKAVDDFREAGGDRENIMTNERRQHAVHGLEMACEQVQTPLSRLEHGLHPWVAFCIMPVFALANAGVAVGSGFGEALTSGVGLGVVFGLLLGKPVGIMLAAWITVKAGLGDLPSGTNWKQVLGASFLAGIGFTMSLFIANLAFRGDSDMLQMAKVGILCGSLASSVIGLLLLRAVTKPATPKSGAEFGA